jgi:type II secretory pathway pseudopilin PulG
MSWFNLVEITLAMAVVGMGVAGVMALFQLSMQNNRDAIGDNYAADAANQFLSFIQMQAREDWTMNIIGLPTAAPAIAEGDTDQNWTAPTFGNIYDAAATGVTNVYGVQQGSDFQAHVRIWRSQITDLWIAGANQSIPYANGAVVNIEISWPVARPYSRREKRTYKLELFKSN